MQWVFPRNEGGQDSGFHHAGVETFRGNLDRYLARELIQNSLDAGRKDNKDPVHVKFELLQLDRAQLPDIDSLCVTFDRCETYWQGYEKVRLFFQEAKRLASKPVLQALRVSDFNTTGVPGGDKERDQNWYSLVRCSGSSSKLGGEGGSFGIGKNAPFAASLLRTVLYSTVSTEDGHAFQGVATLVSHELEDGKNVQPTGFLGGSRGESIRTPDEIPEVFRRSDCGLDITVLEYRASNTWQNDLLYSVLENFWPAIDFGDLVVTVGDKTVQQSNLSDFLDEFSTQDDFTAHLYYNSFKTPTKAFRDVLANLRDVSLHLLAEDDDCLPRRIAMIRKPGMVVFLRGYLRSIVPFCGVFLCRNIEGNLLLRQMEPPRHDIWDPDHPEKGANKRIEAEYMNFIRESLKQLVFVDDAKTIAVPGLSRFLPDDEDSDEEGFDSGDSSKRSETAGRSPLPEHIEGRKIDLKRRPLQPDESIADGGEDDTDVEGEDEEGKLSREGKARGNKVAEGNEDYYGRDAGSKGGLQGKPSVPIRYRTFMSDIVQGIYTLTVRKEKEGVDPIYLVVSTVGDDQKATADILAVRDKGGSEIPVASGVIGPVHFNDGQILQIEFTLSEPLRVAMEVVGHEA